jgi:hypothetical protein
MAVVSDIKREIRKRGRKYPDPKTREKMIAPDNEITNAPKNDVLIRRLRCKTGAWYAIVLPQKILLNIEIIEIFASTSAISPLPSLPHVRVVNTTSPKFASRIMNFVIIVRLVFLDNILSG